MAKLVEVDEAEWNRMQTLQSVAAKIVSNPAARRRLEEAHKLVDPNAATPLLDQDRLANEPLTALKTELSTEIKALREERETERREQSVRQIADQQEKDFARLKSEHRYTDEGVAAVRKLMETKGLLDVGDAVAIFERSNPPQMPSTPAGGMTGQSWGFITNNDESDKDIQALIASKGDNDAVSDRMAMRALQDIRAGR
jgi:hypothetical protein